MPQPVLLKFFILLTVACAYAVVVKTESQVPVEPKANNAINSNWYHQYGSPYTIVSQPHAAAIARDSYSDAATDLGYGAPAIGGVVGGGHGGGHGGGGGGHHHHDQGGASTYHYQVYPGGGHSGGGGGYGVSGDEGDGGGDFGGGSIGLLGLLGLKGLKGLGVIKVIKAFGVLAPIFGPILGPILLPLLAPLLLLLGPLLLLPLLLPLLLLFIPIPVVTIPGRRSFSWRETARMAQDALTSEECFERIACEGFRVARGYGFDAPWMKNYLEKSASKNKWVERISRAAQTPECKTYTCGLVTPVKKLLKLN